MDAKKGKFSVLLWEMMASIYASMLVISVNEELHGFSWAISLRLAYRSSQLKTAPRPLDDNFGVMAVGFLLTWGLATVAFLLLQLTKKLPARITLSHWLGGFISMLGFPLALLYTGYSRLFFLEFEFAITTICVLLYLLRKWPIVTTPLNLLLMIAHFGLWIAFSPRWPIWFLFWPTWHSVLQVAPFGNVIYSLLGFILTVTWSRIFPISNRQVLGTGRAGPPF